VIGRVFDRYVVEAEIGAGGMAVVYRARHSTLGSLHALKVLKVQHPGIRERLVQEGRVQAGLRHPNIVAVTDVVDVDGAPGLVMEFIDGPSLEAWLGTNRPGVAEALAIFRGIASGVSRAHRQGLVHRDLKPGNVLLDTSGDEGIVPKVTDFGLAKILADEEAGSSRTRSGIAMGTPSYMAPEQVRSAKNVDQRADMFALGCILYELVCGERAFGGEDMLATFNAIASGSYEPPESLAIGLPAGVISAIQACLEVDRDRRVPDVAALRALLADGDPSTEEIARIGAGPSGSHARPAAPSAPTPRSGDPPRLTPPPRPAPGRQPTPRPPITGDVPRPAPVAKAKGAAPGTPTFQASHVGAPVPSGPRPPRVASATPAPAPPSPPTNSGWSMAGEPAAPSPVAEPDPFEDAPAPPRVIAPVVALLVVGALASAVLAVGGVAYWLWSARSTPTAPVEIQDVRPKGPGASEIAPSDPPRDLTIEMERPREPSNAAAPKRAGPARREGPRAIERDPVPVPEPPLEEVRIAPTPVGVGDAGKGGAPEAGKEAISPVAEAMGTIAIEGQVQSVRIVREGREFGVGRYDVEVTFPGSGIRAFVSVKVREDATVVVRCNAEFQACTAG
jgi:serine/threonine-protein kinase